MKKLKRDTGYIHSHEFRAGKDKLILPANLQPEELYLGMFAFKSTVLHTRTAKLLSRVKSVGEDEQTGLARVDCIVHDMSNKPKLEVGGLYGWEDGYLDPASLEVDLIRRDPLDSSVNLLPPPTEQYFAPYVPDYNESCLQRILKNAN